MSVTSRSVLPFISRMANHEQVLWLQALSAAMPDETVVSFSELTTEQKAQCDVAIVANPAPIDLIALPNLKWVHSVWAGVERMINELSSPSFSIVRLVDPELAKTMSEAVLAWTLYLHRDIPTYTKQQAKQLWLQRPMVRAQERRIGILGLGELGQVSAKRLVQNGFSVSGWSRQAKQIDGVTCFDGDSGLLSLLKQTDILICLLPLTAQTQGLIGKENLSCLPIGASIINFARGPIIDDEALLNALNQQQLSHAVLDVFMQEPLPADHAYWVNENVSVLPHISAPTHPLSASDIVAANIGRYRTYGDIPDAVDLIKGY